MHKDVLALGLNGAPLPPVDGILLQERLGAGGMGVVFRGVHLRLEIAIAVKFIARESCPAGQFPVEARLAARINHPNVVRAFDVNTAGDWLYIVQEFVDGGCVIAGGTRTNGLRESRALEIAADIARGLHAIHAENMVHLDIKPANVLVTRKGVAKVGDLGLAELVNRELPAGLDFSHKQRSTICGTPGYMSPEQILGMQVTPAADIYSFGVTLYELLAGREAFEGTPPDFYDAIATQLEGGKPDVRTLRPDVSAATASLIQCCMDLEPERRPGSAAAVLDLVIEARERIQRQSRPVSVNSEPLRPLNASVLIVDDDATIRDFVESILREAGHRPFSFADGATALKALTAMDVDVVLLDMEMEGMSGLKVCRHIREQEQTRDLPVVFISGNSDLNVIDAAVKLGATDYLVKPIAPADLLARVNCLAQIQRMKQERDMLQAQYQRMSARTSLQMRKGV